MVDLHPDPDQKRDIRDVAVDQAAADAVLPRVLLPGQRTETTAEIGGPGAAAIQTRVHEMRTDIVVVM